MPGCAADAFEQVAMQHVYTEGMATALAEGLTPSQARDRAHYALMGKTTMFSPKLLLDQGAPALPQGCLSG